MHFRPHHCDSNWPFSLAFHCKSATRDIHSCSILQLSLWWLLHSVNMKKRFFFLGGGGLDYDFRSVQNLISPTFLACLTFCDMLTKDSITNICQYVEVNFLSQLWGISNVRSSNRISSDNESKTVAVFRILSDIMKFKMSCLLRSRKRVLLMFCRWIFFSFHAIQSDSYIYSNLLM